MVRLKTNIKKMKRRTANTLTKRNTTSPSRKLISSPTKKRLISPRKKITTSKRMRMSSPLRVKKSPSPSPTRKSAYKSVSSPRYSFRPPPIPPPSFLTSTTSSSPLDKRIHSSKVVIFGRAGCGWCQKAKEMFEGMGVSYVFVDIVDPSTNFTREEMVRLNEITSPTDTVPRIFINGKFAGGFTETSEKIKNGTIKI